MEKVNWAQKLTSRKLWMAVVGFVTGMLLYFGMDNEQVEKIAKPPERIEPPVE